METAIRLLEKLQDIAHRRPFLGRYLRFELARAFRALFISYRYIISSIYARIQTV